MAASSCGEVAACWIRVPTENVKQKMQAGVYPTTRQALSGIIGSKGWRGFYVGYTSTIMREIPFSFIQFPIYETLKKKGAETRGRPLQPFESAFCGSIGGGVSAAITTPFDVIKTHLMIGARRERGAIHWNNRRDSENMAGRGHQHVLPRRCSTDCLDRARGLCILWFVRDREAHAGRESIARG